jgi:hypothetical protein
LTAGGGLSRLVAMTRSARTFVGGYAYHILNRANGRLRLFRKEADCAPFHHFVALAHEHFSVTCEWRHR